MPDVFDQAVAEAQRPRDVFDEAVAQAAPVPAGDVFDQAVAEGNNQPGFARSALATGARIVTPLAGMAAGGLLGGIPGGMAGGAAGGALGETIAQQIEAPNESLKPLPILGEAALGALPFGKVAKPLEALLPATRLGKAAAVAGEAGLFGAISTPVQTLTREGRLPTAGEEATGTATGAALGGLLGAASFKPEAKLPLAKEPSLLTGPATEGATETAPTVGGLKFEPPAPKDIFDATVQDETIRQAARDERGITQVLAPHEMKALSDVLATIPKDVLADTAAASANLRSNRISGEILQKLQDQGLLNPTSELPEGVQLGQLFMKAASIHGMGLNAVKPMMDYAAGLAGQEADKAYSLGLGDVAKNLLNVRRMLMTQMLGTQIRNVGSATGVGGLTTMARMVSGLMDPDSWIAARGLIKAAVHPVQSYRAGDAFLEALPEHIKAPLMDMGTMAESAINSRLARTTRIFNFGVQQYADKVPLRLALSAFMPESLSRRGLDVNAFIANPDAFQEGLSKGSRILFDEAAGEAAHNAASIPFREQPESKFAQGFVDIVKRYPILTLELPFPRFMASYLNFLSSYGPWGMLKLFAPDFAASGKAGALTFRAADPHFVAQQIGKTAVGTGMLSLALAIRSNPNTAGEKSYEIRVPGIDKEIDTRPWAPLLSPYLSVAQMMLNVSSGKTALANLDVSQIGQEVLGLQRIEGLGEWALSNVFNARSATGLARVGETLEGLIGDTVGSFFTPLRTVKDLIGDYRSVDKKADDSMRLFGPTLGNFPLAAEYMDLPQTIKPTTGLPYSDRTPVNVFGVDMPAGILRQLGISTVEKDAVEAALNQLGIDVWTIAPRTAVSANSLFRSEAAPVAHSVDTRTAQIMGPTVLEVGKEIVSDPSFQGLMQSDPDAAKAYLKSYIDPIKKSARAQAEGELAIASEPSYLALQAAKVRGTGPKGVAKRMYAEEAARQALPLK